MATPQGTKALHPDPRGTLPLLSPKVICTLAPISTTGAVRSLSELQRGCPAPRSCLGPSGQAKKSSFPEINGDPEAALSASLFFLFFFFFFLFCRWLHLRRKFSQYEGKETFTTPLPGPTSLSAVRQEHPSARVTGG